MWRVRSSRQGCTIAKVSAAFKFVFKLFRALLNNMKEAHGGQELVGVVDRGMVEAKSEKKCVVQTFKMSSKLWVGDPRHERNSTNTEWYMEQGMHLGQKDMYE